MGYQIHIFRPKEANVISYEELKKLIDSDDSLLLSESSINEILWVDHPLGGIDGHTPVLYFEEKRISSRHPDEFVTKKMFDMAQQINAALGDDEEAFDDNYRLEIDKSCENILRRNNRKSNKPKWKFW
ncbi:hypothetical protein LDL77_17670 [Flagellimonas marinaquae]|nr:hypothetical protein LDL77_17670 [Allomuricauda aquimarina]